MAKRKNPSSLKQSAKRRRSDESVIPLTGVQLKVGGKLFWLRSGSMLRNSSSSIRSIIFSGRYHSWWVMIRRPSSSATGIGLFDYFCYGLLRMFKGHSIQIFLWTRSFTAPLFGHQTSSQSLMLKPTIGCIKSSCRALTSTSPKYKRSFGLV